VRLRRSRCGLLRRFYSGRASAGSWAFLAVLTDLVRHHAGYMRASVSVTYFMRDSSTCGDGLTPHWTFGFCVATPVCCSATVILPGRVDYGG